MKSHSLVSITSLVLFGAVGTASATINSVWYKDREFNDYPSSSLTVVRNYPTEVEYTETNFGSGTFANRHSAYYSETSGASPKDFNYGDAFDFSFKLNLTATPPDGREAGFHTDLFGNGFFGVLSSGEIAAFGSILPFKTFGIVWTPGQTLRLRMIYTPGDGDGVSTTWTTASTMTYIYDLGAGPVSSGPVPFTTAEGGVPSNFDFLVGFGVQNQGAQGGTSVADFTDFGVPAPGALALLGLGGLRASRRRR